MTISEHLQFSVLTTPIASVDRRALSQAWYSALYGDASLAQSNAPSAREMPEVRSARKPRKTSSPEIQPQAFSGSPAKAHSPAIVRGGGAERRAARSGLARKIERTFLHPRATTRKASFSVDSTHGRVQVLLQSRDSAVRLVAICPPKAAREVAGALAQARYALASRGIHLDVETRGESPC